MGFAAAALHWPPAAFWSATPHEYFAAYEMWREMNTAPDQPIDQTK